MILVKRSRSRAKHSMGRANSCKVYIAKRRSRQSWFPQFYARDSRLPDLSCGISNICVAVLNLVGAQFHKENIGDPLRPELFVECGGNSVWLVNRPDHYLRACLARNARRPRHERLTDALITCSAVNVHVHDVHVACGAIRIATEVIQQRATYIALFFCHQARKGRLSSKAIA